MNLESMKKRIEYLEHHAEHITFTHESLIMAVDDVLTIVYGEVERASRERIVVGGDGVKVQMCRSCREKNPFEKVLKV